MQDNLEYINNKICTTNQKIERDIAASVEERGYMSQSILKELRDLVEFVSFKIYVIENNDYAAIYNHAYIQKAISYIKSRVSHNSVKKIHSLLQISMSHNSYSEDGSIRLMVEYYDYLIDFKNHYYDLFGESILSNIRNYPIFNLDPTLVDYYEQIYLKVKDINFNRESNVTADYYYIIRTKPIVYKDLYFYELTLLPANDFSNKFNRVIFYSKVRIPDNYAIKISYIERQINIFGNEIEIRVVNNYRVAIKSSEFNRLYDIFGEKKRVSTKSGEYNKLMTFLTDTKQNLFDIVSYSQEQFDDFVQMLSSSNTHSIIELLTLIRRIIIINLPGKIVLSYLIYKLRGNVLSDQISSSGCDFLSNLCLKYGCGIFETMPYASSLMNHNPSICDLIDIIDPTGREHELFAKNIQDICDSTNRIYVRFEELNCTRDDAIPLINRFNSNVYSKHGQRLLKYDARYVYYKGYEDSTIDIINLLKEKCSNGYDGYELMVNNFKQLGIYEFTDPKKEEIIENLFKDSSIALVYGSAGTGKTELIKIVSLIFSDKRIAFLAKTNTALNNIKSRIDSENKFYSFSTIDSFIHSPFSYDLLVIDECSMSENYKVLEILEKRKYDCILMTGDIYQIEAISFGNWFTFAKSLVPNASYELLENFRTSNTALQLLWQKVRELDVDVSQKLIDREYSQDISDEILKTPNDDEIVLCLNYDGPYGINSVNRYLQLSNPNPAVAWGINQYKKDDPIIFSNIRNYSNTLYNNLKGKILDVHVEGSSIIFLLNIEKTISSMEADEIGVKLIEASDKNSIIELKVYSKEDEDADDDATFVVPFVVSYAMSIHKAQGLEYDSVKIIISDEIDALITKNIFYTAITRTKNKLKIFWSAECQNKVLKELSNDDLRNDLNIIYRKLNN